MAMRKNFSGNHLLPNVTIMLSTVEVRWFHKGKTPQCVLHNYLQKDQPPIAQPPRFDHYLFLPDQDDLGIKFRQGAIEVKQRTASHGLHHFTAQASGYIETWRKWRFELSPSSQSIPLDLELSRNWISIRKTRYLYRYQRQGSDELHQVPQEMEIPSGCEWELSALQVGKEAAPFWSMAFEAFDLSSSPDPDGMLKFLIRVVKGVFLDLDDMSVTSQASNSYPAFLQRLDPP
jgi:hypothetical protein